LVLNDGRDLFWLCEIGGPSAVEIQSGPAKTPFDVFFRLGRSGATDVAGGFVAPNVLSETLLPKSGPGVPFEMAPMGPAAWLGT
jgi:hypothetical protein